MKRVKWNLKQFIGQRARLLLIDFSSGNWGHISFDDFRGDVDLCEGTTNNQLLFYFMLCYVMLCCVVLCYVTAVFGTGQLATSIFRATPDRVFVTTPYRVFETNSKTRNMLPNPVLRRKSFPAKCYAGIDFPRYGVAQKIVVAS